MPQTTFTSLCGLNVTLQKWHISKPKISGWQYVDAHSNNGQKFQSGRTRFLHRGGSVRRAPRLCSQLLLLGIDSQNSKGRVIASLLLAINRWKSMCLQVAVRRKDAKVWLDWTLVPHPRCATLATIRSQCDGQLLSPDLAQVEHAFLSFFTELSW